MALSATTVYEIATEIIGPCVKSGPHGIDLGLHDFARLERGSGIAGMGERWHLVCRALEPLVTYTSEPVATRAALRRLLRGWLAGGTPTAPPGYRVHAQRLGATGCDYVWIYTRKEPPHV